MSTGYRHPVVTPTPRGGNREAAFRKGYVSGVFAAVTAIYRGATIAQLFGWTDACVAWRDSMEHGPPPEMPASPRRN